LTLKSSQYKKLVPSNHYEENETKNIQPLVFHFSPIDLSFCCFLLCFFVWFARFQILVSELKSIWRKLLVLSWLYWTPVFSEAALVFQIWISNWSYDQHEPHITFRTSFQFKFTKVSSRIRNPFLTPPNKYLYWVRTKYLEVTWMTWPGLRYARVRTVIYSYESHSENGQF
jgi:hypothetical protein